MSSQKALSIWSFGGNFRSSFNSSSKKMRNPEMSLSKKDSGSSSGQEPQDADYDIPCLSDELETMILARFPISKHWKISSLSKHFLRQLKSGEIYRIRRMIKFKEPCVFMLAGGEKNWCAFDGKFRSFKKLPVIPTDYNFECGDKESFCAGTNLFVSGKEIEGSVIWIYELEKHQWFKGPSMISPRCLFASASCDTYAFVAGGLEPTTREVLSSAEKYISETKSWEPLPRMIQKRKSCSGCYLDNKFYVLGGQDENRKDLFCGEYFDEETNTWNLIPSMLKDVHIPLSRPRSPPLIAVANNWLYTLDASSNEIKVYLKGSNRWKKLGQVPVRADAQGGWGVAFKSLGNELLLIGATSNSYSQREFMTIYTCYPDPYVEKLEWKKIESGSINLNPFIHNCAVMLA